MVLINNGGDASYHSLTDLALPTTLLVTSANTMGICARRSRSSFVSMKAAAKSCGDGRGSACKTNQQKQRLWSLQLFDSEPLLSNHAFLHGVEQYKQSRWLDDERSALLIRCSVKCKSIFMYTPVKMV